MSPTNQFETFGWGSNNNTSNGGGGGYQSTSTTTTYINNSSSYNYNNKSYGYNNSSSSSGGAQQLPNFQETWGTGGTVKSGSGSIFGEMNNNFIISLYLIFP